MSFPYKTAIIAVLAIGALAYRDPGIRALVDTSGDTAKTSKETRAATSGQKPQTTTEAPALRAVEPEERAPATSKVFKWTDKNGRTHYSNDQAAAPKSASEMKGKSAAIDANQILPARDPFNPSSQQNERQRPPSIPSQSAPAENATSAANSPDLSDCPSIGRAKALFEAGRPMAAASRSVSMDDVDKGLLALCSKSTGRPADAKNP